MDDRRVSRTKTAIRRAFERLIVEKPLHKITVSEITEMADVGRSTFYSHFDDVYDLHEQTYAKWFRDLDKELGTPDTTKLHKFTDYQLQYIVDNEKYLYVLKHYYNQRIYADEHAKQGDLFTIVKAAFWVSGILGIMEAWLGGEMDVSKEELFALIHRLYAEFDVE